MSTTPISYRVVIGNDEEWCADTAAADAAVARLVSVPPEQVRALARPTSVDPVVVRRDDGRWRSRRVWTVRSGSSVARVYEMLKVDEAAYDH